MKLPRLTAEYGLGPALHSYATAPSATFAPAGTFGPAGTSGPGAVAPMDFFSDLGSVFTGVFNKVPCLISCGLPNALSIAGQCGFDPACWISHAPALAGCINQCLQ